MKSSACLFPKFFSFLSGRDPDAMITEFSVIGFESHDRNMKEKSIP